MRLIIGRSFFFQAEDGIRDLVRSRGLGDVYKRQVKNRASRPGGGADPSKRGLNRWGLAAATAARRRDCLLYTSDAADERSSVDLGGRRIIKKKKTRYISRRTTTIDRCSTRACC